MSKAKTLSILFSLLLLASCKKEYNEFVYVDYDNTGTEYADYVVDFFSEHPEFTYIEPKFETVTEQLLVREAHRAVGATFDIVTETVITQSAYQVYKILESEMIYVVDDAEANSVKALTCYNFLSEDEFEETEVPATYETRTYYRVVDEGTGPEVPAEYTTRIWKLLVTPGQIVPRDNTPREYDRIIFRVPKEQTIQSYLNQQLTDALSINCEAGSSYIIGG